MERRVFICWVCDAAWEASGMGGKVDAREMVSSPQMDGEGAGLSVGVRSSSSRASRHSENQAKAHKTLPYQNVFLPVISFALLYIQAPIT